MSFKNIALISSLFCGLFVSSSNSAVEEQIVAYNPRLPHIALRAEPERIERPLGLVVPLHMAEAIAASKHELRFHFIGSKGFRPEIVAFFKRMNLKDISESFVKPLPVLEGPANELLTFLKGCSGNQAHDLRVEIESQKQRGTSPMQLTSYYARYARIISPTFTPLEKDLFDHAPSPHIFKGLSSEKSLGSEFAPFMSTSDAQDDDVYNEGWESHGGASFLSWDVRDRLKTEFKKKSPEKIVIFRPGSGKFGVTFLVRQYLQGVFPVGIPSKPVKVHGVELSPLGFGVHDFLHSKIDRRYKKLRSRFIQEADKYVKEGGRGEDFVEHYAPYIIGQHERLMGGLLGLSDLFLARLLPYDRQAYEKAMVGFFFAIHEYPHFSEGHLSENSLERILSCMISSTKEFVGKGDESSDDPLNTSPIDGSSALSPEEIKRVAFQEFIEDAQTYSELRSSKGDYIWNDPSKSKDDKKKLLLPFLAEVTLESSPNNYDVIFKLKSGKQQRYSFTTYHYKWHNVEDPLALLRMAGISMQKPELPADRDEARKVAHATLNAVSVELKKCLDCFEHWGSYFLSQAYGADDSLQDDYFLSYGEHKRAVTKILTALRKKAQKDQQSFDFLL
jgi:hypothetical protein